MNDLKFNFSGESNKNSNAVSNYEGHLLLLQDFSRLDFCVFSGLFISITGSGEWTIIYIWIPVCLY